MRVAALIPARSGSVRIKDKNIRALGDYPLIGRKIKQLQDSRVDNVFLGSDDIGYLDIAVEYGATPVRRSTFSCDEKVCTSNDMISDFVKRIPNDYDVILWAHCTNPFLYARHYDEAINQFIANSYEYDSLFSVEKVQNHMWDQRLNPINYDPWADKHTLAKDLKPVYFQTGGIFIQWAKEMKMNNYFFGNKPNFVIHNSIEALDIDTEYDFQLASALASIVDAKENFDGS